MRFVEILDERNVDPIDLANRVGKKYGTQERDYGYIYSDTVKGKYIPLKSYSETAVDEIEQELFDVYKEFGWQNAERAERVKIRKRVENEASSVEQIPINKLNATQPFVRIEDIEILKNKIDTTKEIRVVKFVDDFYIIDGHHAVLAARLRGEKQIKSKVIDLDYLQEKYL